MTIRPIAPVTPLIPREPKPLPKNEPAESFAAMLASALDKRLGTKGATHAN